MQDVVVILCSVYKLPLEFILTGGIIYHRIYKNALDIYANFKYFEYFQL